jgi:Sigma-70, region 4
MNRERAETYLRLLAEAELRCAATQPGDGAPPPGTERAAVALLRQPVVGSMLNDLPVLQREVLTLRYRAGLSEAQTAAMMHISRGAVQSHAARGIWMLHAALHTEHARLRRAAHVLTAVGALDEEAADQILDDVKMAMFARRAGAGRLRMEQLLRLVPVRRRSAGTATSRPGPTRVVSLGQRVTLPAGELYLLAYARTASGPQLSVFARMRESAGPDLFDPLAATDDQGTSYQVHLRDIGNGPMGWTLMLRPDPPHDPRWLDLATTPGGPAVRIDLAGPAAGTAADMTVREAGLSPGEYLLNTLAARLLAAASTAPPDRLTLLSDGLGDVVAALQGCGALSLLSLVPGQLAALCAGLDIGGHGITAPPVDHLPEPWLSLLSRYRRRKVGAAPARDGCVAATVVLPELDGIRLTLLGLHNSEGRTILHMHASGPRSDLIYGPDELYAWPALWVRDDHGHWHATRTVGRSGMNDGVALRMEVVPPLSRTTTRIELLAAAQAAEARATVPLHWE